MIAPATLASALGRLPQCRLAYVPCGSTIVNERRWLLAFARHGFTTLDFAEHIGTFVRLDGLL